MWLWIVGPFFFIFCSWFAWHAEKYDRTFETKDGIYTLLFFGLVGGIIVIIVAFFQNHLVPTIWTKNAFILLVIYIIGCWYGVFASRSDFLRRLMERIDDL
ncbi:hypothetical protein ACFL11_00895 [Patescibacteria group bacterium]